MLMRGQLRRGPPCCGAVCCAAAPLAALRVAAAAAFKCAGLWGRAALCSCVSVVRVALNCPWWPLRAVQSVHRALRSLFGIPVAVPVSSVPSLLLSFNPSRPRDPR
jgi:hypothetical protein